MSIKLAVSPVLLIFLLLSHVMLSLSLSLSFPPGHRVTCSLSLSVSLGLSLALPPALATVPTVSAERPLLLALGASAACGAARGAGALGAAPGTKSGAATCTAKTEGLQ